MDFFLPHFPQLDVYVQPREFDPGQYQLTRENGAIMLSNRFASRLSRSDATVHLELTKRLSGARNPLRTMPCGLFDGLQYAGYAVRTRLAFRGGLCEPMAIGLWCLLQLPHGGEL